MQYRNLKYRITNTKKTVNGVTLQQIESLSEFGNVKKGDLGGWIESEANLEQPGSCWVADDAQVFGDARVKGNAVISGSAQVSENAHVLMNARIHGNASVSGNARVMDNAHITDNARVTGYARIVDNAQIAGNALVGAGLVCCETRLDGDTVKLD